MRPSPLARRLPPSTAPPLRDPAGGRAPRPTAPPAPTLAGLRVSVGAVAGGVSFRLPPPCGRAGDPLV
eukprot:14042072-Alexandrium_andersonii.AAC.1